MWSILPTSTFVSELARKTENSLAFVSPRARIFKLRVASYGIGRRSTQDPMVGLESKRLWLGMDQQQIVFEIRSNIKLLWVEHSRSVENDLRGTYTSEHKMALR